MLSIKCPLDREKLIIISRQFDEDQRQALIADVLQKRTKLPKSLHKLVDELRKSIKYPGFRPDKFRPL